MYVTDVLSNRRVKELSVLCWFCDDRFPFFSLSSNIFFQFFFVVILFR